MEFYPMKCEHLTFSRERKSTDNNYKLHSNTSFPKVSLTKYLGIHVDSKLTWQKPQTQSTSSASMSRHHQETSDSPLGRYACGGYWNMLYVPGTHLARHRDVLGLDDYCLCFHIDLASCVFFFLFAGNYV